MPAKESKSVVLGERVGERVAKANQPSGKFKPTLPLRAGKSEPVAGETAESEPASGKTAPVPVAGKTAPVPASGETKSEPLKIDVSSPKQRCYHLMVSSPISYACECDRRADGPFVDGEPFDYSKCTCEAGRMSGKPTCTPGACDFDVKAGTKK